MLPPLPLQSSPDSPTLSFSWGAEGAFASQEEAKAAFLEALSQVRFSRAVAAQAGSRGASASRVLCLAAGTGTHGCPRTADASPPRVFTGLTPASHPFWLPVPAG